MKLRQLQNAANAKKCQNNDVQNGNKININDRQTAAMDAVFEREKIPLNA